MTVLFWIYKFILKTFHLNHSHSPSVYLAQDTIKKCHSLAQDIAQVLELLPIGHKALRSSPSTAKSQTQWLNAVVCKCPLPPPLQKVHVLKA
jgi:hypothetical protein